MSSILAKVLACHQQPKTPPCSAQLLKDKRREKERRVERGEKGVKNELMNKMFFCLALRGQEDITICARSH